MNQETITIIYGASDKHFIHFWKKLEATPLLDTKKNITKILLDNLDRGESIYIHKLGSNIHPSLILYIINKYQDKDINKKNAKLIFTTYNTCFLNIIDKKYIYLINTIIYKQEEIEDFLYPLSNFNIGDKQDIEKTYLQGFLGGTPKLLTETKK